MGENIKYSNYQQYGEGTALFASVVGATGDTGPAGLPGITGGQGYTGDTGPIGLKGITGDNGYLGYTGPTGMQGNTGDTGDKGYTGPTGYIGVPDPIATRISVSNNNTITTGYIPFSSSKDSGVSLMTSNALTYNANTRTLTVGNINVSNYVSKSSPSITNNLTLPTSIPTPTTSQKGFQVYGTKAVNGGIADGSGLANGVDMPANTYTTQATIALPSGVWAIYSSIWFVPTDTSNAIFTTMISSDTNDEDTSHCGFSLSGSTNTLSDIISPVSRVVTITTSSKSYYLVAKTSLGVLVDGNTLNHILFYAFRIA